MHPKMLKNFAAILLWVAMISRAIADPEIKAIDDPYEPMIIYQAPEHHRSGVSWMVTGTKWRDKTLRSIFVIQFTAIYHGKLRNFNRMSLRGGDGLPYPSGNHTLIMDCDADKECDRQEMVRIELPAGVVQAAIINGIDAKFFAAYDEGEIVQIPAEDFVALMKAIGMDVN